MKNPKIYYGWIVLFCLALMYVASNGYGYLTIPAFYPKLTEAFGVEKGIVPQSASILTFLIAFLSPIMGYLLDRYDARKILTVSVFGLLGALFYFTQITTLNEFRIFNLTYAVFLSLGGLVTSIYIVNQWFDKHRGIATGLFLNASSLGAAFFNPYVGKQLASLPWAEVATNAFYIVAVLFLLPIAFVKAKPTQKDIENSGEFVSGGRSMESVGISLQQAIKSPYFWLLLTVTAGLWFCINFLIFHKDTILNDLQLNSKQAGQFGMYFFLCGIVGKLVFGFLSDRFDRKKIMMASISCILVGSILFKMALNNVALLPMVAVIFGIGYSGSFTMIQLLIAEYYKGKSYGSILGVFVMADTLAGALGIKILGVLRTNSGSYQSSFVVLICICLLALLATFFVKKPEITV